MMKRLVPRLGLFLVLASGLCIGCGGEKTTTVTGEVTFGTIKPMDGEQWVIMLQSGTEKNYSGNVEADGKFTIANVSDGGYKIEVMHYLPTGTKAPASSKSGSTAPKMYGYPELLSVPGGPYALNFSKLKPK